LNDARSTQRPEPASERTVTLFGAALFALLPFSTDIYLPAMVDIGTAFGTSLGGVQLTMVAFTAGFALSHLAIGRLADRFGRRPVALGGLAIFAGTAVLGALSPTLAFLIAARFLQGAAAATGPILARTIIRDVVNPSRAGRALSLMGALVGVAPVLAPILGGLAAHLAGWRATLGLLAAYACGLLIVVALRFPETIRRPERPAATPSSLHVLGLALRERSFVFGAVALTLGYGILFTWLSTSAFLLIGELGLTRLEASLVYAIGSAGFVGGGLASARLSARLPADQILQVASVLVLGGTGLALAVTAAGWTSWAAIVAALLPFYVGWGFCQPHAIAIAMAPFAETAGQASAWLGAFQQLGGIALSFLAVGLGGGLWTLAVMSGAALLLMGVTHFGRTSR
jgi:DHA1 family bicyclomycin/chloramphenicol resistance-like MFS transporter